ncbi:MAG: GTPase [Candidatus Thermoplasmatota archaeon]|nr:GTPase [Candidatus Thermoplasmatota archaeon]
MDKANRRANKVQVADPAFRFRMQKLNRAKVESFEGTINASLEKYVTAFPSFSNLDPFYLALMDLLISVDDVRRILGRIDGVRKQIGIIKKKTIRQIDRTSKSDYMSLKRKEAFGRIASMVKDLRSDLEILADAREKFKEIPSIPTKHPTVVVAGYPSVGKSQLVKNISTADPKVASYPFTTQELTVGYFEHNRQRYQIIDTPGLLDRPFQERNPIEKQAILALTLLSNVCIFIIDPTGHCGYPLEPQVELLLSTFNAVPGMNFMVIDNKSDLSVPDGVDLGILEEAVKEMGDRCIVHTSVSAFDEERMKKLKKHIVDSILASEEKPWEDFQE